MLANTFLVTNRPKIPGKENLSRKIFSMGNLKIYSSFADPSPVFQFLQKGENFYCIWGNCYGPNLEDYSLKSTLKWISEQPNPMESPLGGLFCLIHANTRDLKISVRTEEMGASPIFYNHTQAGFSLSNHSLILGQESSPDPVSIYEFLQFGYLPVSPSFFENIQRIFPGQILNYFINENKISVSKPKTFAYPNIKERNQNAEEILESLYHGFSEFFARFSEKRVFMGLSGGYDSRLIAAFLEKNPQKKAIHFLNSDTIERFSAEKAAELSGFSLQKENFPEDAPFLYRKRLATQFRNPTNWEYSHVLHLQNKVFTESPELYFDGYIGDTILGGTYFEPGNKGLTFLLRYLSFSYNWNHPLKNIDFYNNIYFKDRERISEEKLSFPESIKKTQKERMLNLLNVLYEKAHTEEDLLESWKHNTRARTMISMGPTGIQTQIPAICPFLDPKIRHLCLSLPKEYRAMDRIYNQFWNKFFPSYAHLPKSRTGAKPIHGNFLYRCEHIRNTLAKKIRAKLSPLRPEDYFSAEKYLNHPKNDFLSESISHNSIFYPFADFVKNDSEIRLKLRISSLKQYLEPTI